MESKPDRTALTAVLVLFLGAIPLSLASPFTAPLFLVPVAALVWTLRARVVADADHLDVCNGLGVRRIAWTQVERFEIRKRRPIQLHLTDHAKVALTALPKQKLPALLAVGQP